jgi:hypothetical protein
MVLKLQKAVGELVAARTSLFFQKLGFKIPPPPPNIEKRGKRDTLFGKQRRHYAFSFCSNRGSAH